MTGQIAISLEKPGHFVEKTESMPEVSVDGDVSVRVRRMGVCGTDIHAYRGRQPFFSYPRILGHELGVEVLDGQTLPPHLKPGMLCSVEPYLNDPKSPASRKGLTNCCDSLQVLGVHIDGGMRPRIVVPVQKLHPGKSLSADDLALVEMLCIGQHAVTRGGVGKDDFAVVFGAGPIGMSVATFLKGQAGKVAIVDLNAGRLQFCKEGIGVEETLLLSDSVDLDAALREASGDGQLPDVVFDATGHPGSMARTFECVAQGGRIILVGLFQGELSFNDPNFHRREITLMASRNATGSDFTDVIRKIEDGTVDTAPWITHRMELGDVSSRFESVINDSLLRKAMISLD